MLNNPTPKENVPSFTCNCTDSPNYTATAGVSYLTLYGDLGMGREPSFLLG